MIVRSVSLPAGVRAVRKGFTLIEVVAVTAILLILVSLMAFGVVTQMDKAKVNEAKIKMGKIENAAKQYYIESGGNWPSSVMELVQPTNGGGALLEGGLAAVTDPWGSQFQMQPQPDQAGNERIVIITTNPKTGTQIVWPQQ